MGGKAGDMLDLMRDILLTARLDDRQRFTQMVAETKAGMESGESSVRCPQLDTSLPCAACSDRKAARIVVKHKGSFTTLSHCCPALFI